MGGHGNYYTLIGGHRLEKVGNHCARVSAEQGGKKRGE